MTDTARRVQLGEDRLVEIRTLVQQLGRPDQDQAPRLLADARTALLDLLDDRADLVPTHHQEGHHAPARRQ